MRKNGILINAMVMLATASAASAENFRSEISAAATTSKFERSIAPFSETLTNKGGIISGTYYFSEVTVGSHPLAEAAFLERSSGISFTYSQNRLRNSSIPNYDSFVDEYRTTLSSTISTADLNFYFPNSLFYLGGSLAKVSTEMRSEAIIGEESYSGYGGTPNRTLWTLRAGIAPTDGLLIWSEFFEDQKVNDQWNLNAKYLISWDNSALNLEASYDRAYGSYIRASSYYDGIYTNFLSDGVTRLALAADYYLDRTFSLGLTYSHHDTSYMGDDYGLRLRKFFTDKFAIEASVATSTGSLYDSDERYQVGATLRF